METKLKRALSTGVETAEESKQGELVPLFVRAEKNLIALGFFTPTSKKLKRAREKVISFNRAGESGQAESSIKIVTAGNYGLPGTADLDKYLALQSLITEMQRRGQEIINPIKFTTAELLNLLGQKDSGKHYRMVEGFLDRMFATTIEAKGVVLLPGQKHYRKERIRVFDRVVTIGRELEPGQVAECNHIWFSEWQLQNINSNHTVPVDFAVYRLLRNPVAKTLVPLLQIWLYASRADRSFEKRYDELCQLLGIEQYRTISEIKRKLTPALEELTKFEYLAAWDIEKSKVTGGYKLILRHGDKFYRDLSRQLSRYERQPKQLTPTENDLAELIIARGVTTDAARRIVRERPEGQSVKDVQDIIEFVDALIAAAPEKYTNPPGLYYRLITNNAPIPQSFETTRERATREALESVARDNLLSEHETRNAYLEYRKLEIKNYIKQLSGEEYDRMMAEAREQFKTEHPEAAKIYNEENTIGVCTGIVERRVEGLISFISFEVFAASYIPPNAA